MDRWRDGIFEEDDDLVANRWGDGLFEGDDDFAAIKCLFSPDEVPGLRKDVMRLRLKAWEQDQLNKKEFGDYKDTTEVDSNKTDKKPTKKELAENWEGNVGLYKPRFPRLVRNCLDSGVLADLIDEHSAPCRDHTPWSKDWGHKHVVLIAYCAMELGCTLPPGFRMALYHNFGRVGLTDGEYEQMRRACDEYVDGKPYKFVGLHPAETPRISYFGYIERPEPQPPGLEPLPSQEDTADEQPASKRRKVEPKASATLHVEEYCFYFPPDTCANCGATEGHGAPGLKRCKRCKNTLYCFEGCQKWHWSRHRHHCALAQEDEESAQGESTDNGGGISKDEVENTTA